MQNGGRRPGAGRKKGKRTAVQQAAIDIAAQVLREVDAMAIWKRLLLCDELKVVGNTIQYLTNRVHGMPAQKIVGDPNNPLVVNVQWTGGKPEWLPK